MARRCSQGAGASFDFLGCEVGWLRAEHPVAPALLAGLPSVEACFDFLGCEVVVLRRRVVPLDRTRAVAHILLRLQPGVRGLPGEGGFLALELVGSHRAVIWPAPALLAGVASTTSFDFLFYEVDVAPALLAGFDFLGCEVDVAPALLAGVAFVDASFDFLGCEVDVAPALLAGLPFADAALSRDDLRPGLAMATGPTRKRLAGGRTALNILSRCSGAALYRAAAAADDLGAARGWHGSLAVYLSGSGKRLAGDRAALDILSRCSGVALYKPSGSGNQPPRKQPLDGFRTGVRPLWVGLGRILVDGLCAHIVACLFLPCPNVDEELSFLTVMGPLRLRDNLNRCLVYNSREIGRPLCTAHMRVDLRLVLTFSDEVGLQLLDQVRAPPDFIHHEALLVLRKLTGELFPCIPLQSGDRALHQ